MSAITSIKNYELKIKNEATDQGQTAHRGALSQQFLILHF
jgi:hypothetical protein